MKQNFTINNQIDEQKWDAFVESHPQGNIFQTASMFRVFSQTKGYKPFRFWAIDNKTNKILSVLLGTLVCEKEGLMGKFSTRAIIQGGPLVLNQDSRVAHKLIQAFDEAVKDRAIWSEIWNMTDLKDTLSLIKNYHFEDHLDFLIDLTQTETDLWRKISSTRRQNLHHAERFQVNMAEVKNKRQLKIFYQLLEDTYSRANLPLVDISLFEAIYEILVPRQLASFWLAAHHKKFISAFLTLNYQKTIYNWYAGTDPTQYDLYPNSFLAWEVIKWAKNNNFKIFDFGGAGKPNVPYGPREFKRQFGGDLVNFGRFIHIYSPWKYHLAHLGLKVYQWVLTQLKGGKS